MTETTKVEVSFGRNVAFFHWTPIDINGKEVSATKSIGNFAEMSPKIVANLFGLWSISYNSD